MSNCEAGYFHRPTALRFVGPILRASGDVAEWAKLFATPALERTLSNGLRVRVLPDGIFLFDFEDWKSEFVISGKKGAERIWAQRRSASLLNAHLVCLYTAIHHSVSQRLALVPRHMHVSVFDMILLHSDHAPNPGALFEMSPFALDELIHALRRPEQQFDLTTIDVPTVERSLKLFEDILKLSDDYLVTVLELFLRARNAIEESDYVLCLTLAWTAAENLIDRLWLQYIEQNRTRTIDGEPTVFITRDRKERLRSKDYTAAIISEVLSLNGALPFDLFNLLTEARKSRNDWLHRLKPVARAEAEAGLSCVRKLLALVHGLDLGWYFVHHSERG